MNLDDRRSGAETSEAGGRVRYRATWQQSLPLTLVLGFLVIVEVSNPLVWEHQRSGMSGLPFGSRVLDMVLPFVLVLEILVLNRYVGVTLTPEAAVVHNLLRRTIPWTDVSEVAVEPFVGGRRVVLYEVDGRRTPLRMPSTGFLSRDRGFEDKVATIRSRWLANGGVAPAEDHRLPERLRIRPASTRSVPTFLLFGWVATEALLSGFLTGPGADQPTLLGRTVAAIAAIALMLGAGFLSFGRSVVLTADHLAVRGRRLRTVPWSEIEAIAVERRRGGRRIIVREAGGRRTPLPAPRVGLLLWDSEFEEKALTLRHWWHTYACVGTPPTGAAPQESDQPPLPPYSGPRLWQKGLVALVCVVLGGEILLSVLVGSLLLTVGR